MRVKANCFCFRHAPNRIENVIKTKLPQLQVGLDNGYFRCDELQC